MVWARLVRGVVLEDLVVAQRSVAMLRTAVDETLLCTASRELVLGYCGTVLPFLPESAGTLLHTHYELGQFLASGNIQEKTNDTPPRAKYSRAWEIDVAAVS